MDCNLTSIRPPGNPRQRGGFTFIELMIASAIGAILLLAISALSFYTTRSFAALANYVDLDNYSRNALDRMSKEIRQANRLLEGTDTKLVFENFNGAKLTYTYDPLAKTLSRAVDGVPDKLPFLKECDYLKFAIFQRNPIQGTYDQYPTATADTCKLVQLKWVCSRSLIKAHWNTESVQSAKIVIRKQ